MPDPLLRWHEFAAAWDVPLARFNDVLRPDELWREGDKTIFYVENQGVWLWAVVEIDATFPVYDRENVPAAAWQPAGEGLEPFLVHVAVIEAILGSQHGGSAAWVTRGQLAAVVGSMRPVPMPPWRWPGPEMRVWAGEATLAFAAVNDRPGADVGPDSLFSLYLAAQDPGALDVMGAIPQREWDSDSRRGE